MKRKILQLVPPMFLFLSALPAFAAAPTTVKALVEKIITEIINPLIYLMFGIAFVVFLWGIIQYVIAQTGDEKKLADARRIMVWGIIGLFIMSSAWGIVTLLCNSFGTCT